MIVTHYHPDHAGNAAWLCQRYGVELWMTQGEYLTAHAVRSSTAGYTTDAVLSVFRKNGLDEQRAVGMGGARQPLRRAGARNFRSRTGASSRATQIAIGKHRWRAIDRPRPCARAPVAVLRRT